MFKPIVTFNNRIFIPKIVPLVYDDTLSYYEFLCKVLNKMNEAIEVLNALGLRVDDLEAAVNQIQEIVNTIDGRLTAVEGDVITIKSNITNINNAITNINNSIDGINNQLSEIVTSVENNTDSINQINSAISDIQDSLVDVATLPGEVENLDSRVTTLEAATFGDISVSPTPKNPACNMTARNTFDWEIINDTQPDPGFSEYQIMLPDETEAASQGVYGFRFRGNNRYGKSRLILKNFLPEMQDTEILTLVFKFNPAFSVLQYGQVISTTFGNLKAGISCMYQGEDNVVCGGAKAVLNSDTNYSYDVELTVYNPNLTYETIENSYYSLNFFSIIGGSGYTSQGRIAVEDVEPYFMNYQFLKNGSEELAELENRVDVTEGQIGDLQGSYFDINADVINIKSDITSIHSKDTQQDSSISTLNSKVAALEGGGTVEEWNNWSDIFQEASIPVNTRIIGCHFRKIGKLVVFELAGCHFRNDSNHPYSTFCLGTIRSGLRSKLTPKGNIPVMFTGFTAHTDGNLTGIVQDGDTAHTEYTPLVPDGQGIAILSLFGSTTQVPYTWNNRNNQAYSINVNLCNMGYQTQETAVTNNAFVVSGCYVTN